MAKKLPKYTLNPKTEEFIIENYNTAKPFANFFPGIAGLYGIPIWVFYVNRGQAISGFGTKDKDHAIMEFFPANKAWQLTSLQGFRTFIKISQGKSARILLDPEERPVPTDLSRPKRREASGSDIGVKYNSLSSQGKNAVFYEPFSDGSQNPKFNISNSMSISSYGLKLQETNTSLGIKTNIEYFTIPNDNFGALARIVTLTNISKTTKKIQLVDGLPQIVCFGINNWFLKKMSRTIEAWINVKNLENNAPFYKLAVEPTDRPEVIHIKEGNFYLAFHNNNGKNETIKPIVDPKCVFGQVTDLISPYEFINSKSRCRPKEEMISSKTPCGFLYSNFQLKPSQEKTFYSLSGYMRNQEILNASISKIIAPGYLLRKKEENKNIIEDLQNNAATKSNFKIFDLYAKQTYLDNLLRGGLPVTFGYEGHNTTFYSYSRKHGDLERDYNKFLIQPTYFSQGNGNYRDVNQNRRSDTWFNPDVQDENVINFFNLLQADGFNPLIVKGISFHLKNNEEFKSKAKEFLTPSDFEKIYVFLKNPFTPGEIILFFEENKIKLNKISYNEFLGLLLTCCEKNHEAEHGEGFWTDHWTYNLDLLESYLAVYPENLQEIIFDKKCFTFFDNIEVVKPRSEKYALYAGKVKQLHAISADTAKKELIRQRPVSAHTVRMKYGLGEIYQTTLINKLLCLMVNKTASLDPFGIGIEMEANKPDWYDALNGLPALLGSSSCETFELKRLIIFIKNCLNKIGIKEIHISEEIYGLLASLNSLIIEYFKDTSSNKDFLFWDKSHSYKEEYWHKTKLGFSGIELKANTTELIIILDNFLNKISRGLEKAYDSKNKVYYAYFINEITEHELSGPTHIKPLKFIQKKLPLFLESQVHALKTLDNIKKAKALYSGVQQSLLYDKKLKMYKVNAPLADMPEEIGRCRIFTPGWLENESIWLHMEYKYLLEILKSGLDEEFYKEFKSLLIPFQKPQVYGRSILENSSFIVSSAFPDKSLHGNGFVARLSGSTAEFLQIWLIMNSGLKPFSLNEKKELNLRFEPILAGWLFDKKGLYSFNFLGKIKVTYHNPKRKNTFGKGSAKISKIEFKDKTQAPVQLNSNTIPAPYAQQIRDREIKQINIFFK
ncbi:MAG: cellobiose phosphorylase [Candidatus Omnitrophota bacterium]